MHKPEKRSTAGRKGTGQGKRRCKIQVTYLSELIYAVEEQGLTLRFLTLTGSEIDL